MFIFSNLAISLDGKIATVMRGHFPLGTPKDRSQMQLLRRRADAVLMGASSLRAYKGPCNVPGSNRQPISVILSSKLRGVSPSWPFFKHPNVKRILLISEALSKSRLHPFQKTSEVILLPKPNSNSLVSSSIIQILKTRGIKNLLIEGGGEVMWEFVKDNLIDEYHVTLTPHLLGGRHAPTLVDGLGLIPKSVINLKLKQIRKIKNEIFLIYRKSIKRGLPT